MMMSEMYCLTLSSDLLQFQSLDINLQRYLGAPIYLLEQTVLLKSYAPSIALSNVFNSNIHVVSYLYSYF